MLDAGQTCLVFPPINVRSGLPECESSQGVRSFTDFDVVTLNCVRLRVDANRCTVAPVCVCGCACVVSEYMHVRKALVQDGAVVNPSAPGIGPRLKNFVSGPKMTSSSTL